MWAIILISLLASPGCEIGSRWFSMSSDSPMPWFGVDLLPRRKTTQIMPHRRDLDAATRAVATKQLSRESFRQNPPDKVWFRELHLPSIPAYFDQDIEEELSFRGPSGPFSR